MSRQLIHTARQLLRLRWLFAALLGLSVATVAHADVQIIYKWLDAKGITQYTEHPPTDKDIEVVEIRTDAGDSNQAAAAKEEVEKRVEGLNARREEKKLAEEQTAEGVALKKQIDEFCTVTKDRLSQFKSGRRLTQQQEDGSYIPVTEEQRLEQIKKMEGDIKEQCN